MYRYSFTAVPGLRLLSFLAVLLLPYTGHALTIAAANSTCESLSVVGELYSRQHGVRIEYICKSSGLLAKGLEGKAIQADIYLSASEEWMEKMKQLGLLETGSVFAPWSNTLVVAVPVNSPLTLSRWEELASGKVQHIMIGDPGTAPFGRYAKEALEASKLWEQVRVKIETKKHITLLAEHLAAADPHTVGILFKTNLGSGLRAVLTVPPTLHEPINYYIGRLKDAAEVDQAERFLRFLRTEEARKVFDDAGFTPNSP